MMLRSFLLLGFILAALFLLFPEAVQHLLDLRAYAADRVSFIDPERQRWGKLVLYWLLVFMIAAAWKSLKRS